MSLATDPAFDLAFPLAFPLGRVWAEVSPISQEAQAVQRRAADLGAPLSDARLAWFDATIVRPLKASGVIAASDRLFFPGRMPSETVARINVASPGTGDLVPTGGPTFAADDGYTCDGTDDHLLMGLTISTAFAGTKWQLDSAHVWMRVAGTTTSTTRWLVAQTAGSTTIGLALSNGNASVGAVNNGAATFGAAGGVGGLFLATRRNATHVRGYEGGILVSEQAAASGAPGGNRVIAAMRSGTSYTAGRVEAFGIGAQLSDDQIAALQAVSVAAWSGTPPA